jgi:hypothetical protein
MRRRLIMTDEVEASIKAGLEKTPHASLLARESKGAWSYATVWRIAERAGIELTARRKTMGRPRLPPEKRAKVEEAAEAHPEARQEDLARQCGVSRSTVGRAVRARRAALALAG